METILEVNSLTKRLDGFTLKDINLVIPKGSVVGMLGPNGAGKTTLIKLLMNQLEPDSGHISLFGESYLSHEKQIKNSIGYIPELPNFFYEKTIGWTGRFSSRLFENWNQELFDQYLYNYRLGYFDKIKNLSIGEKKKLAFSIAFAHGADLFIFDEPTAGMDPLFRRAFQDQVRKLVNEKQKTFFISSHMTDDLMKISDTLVFLDYGKIILSSDKDDLTEDWKKLHFYKGSLTHEQRGELTQIVDHSLGSSGITRNFSKLPESINSKIAKGDIKVENMSLDDILFSLSQGGQDVDHN